MMASGNPTKSHFCFNNLTGSPGQGLQPGWHVGRIGEGQFEYDTINGWMTPR